MTCMFHVTEYGEIENTGGSICRRTEYETTIGTIGLNPERIEEQHSTTKGAPGPPVQHPPTPHGSPGV